MSIGTQENSTAYTAEEHDLAGKGYKHWQSLNHLMRADELSGVIDILNALASNMKLRTILFTENYVHLAPLVHQLDWTPHDGFPKKQDGSVSEQSAM